MPDTTTPAEALLRSVIDAYRAYRRRGVAPAPNQYGDLVRAIEMAEAALAAPAEGQQPAEPGQRWHAGWLVSNSEGDEEFINNETALQGRHYKGGAPLALSASFERAAPRPGHADGFIVSGHGLLARLQSLKVLLGTDSPEVRGWAPVVQRNAQATVNAAISAFVASACDVRRILLAVVPGEDGMGHEFYAESVADVERELSRMGERIEELESQRATAPAPAQAEKMHCKHGTAFRYPCEECDADAEPAPAEASADLSAAILALPLPEPVSMVASSADGFFSREQVRALLESAASLVRATPPDLAAELRENAARYEWLRAQHWASSPLCVVCDPKDAVKLGRTCPSGEYLDMEIDALRAKGGAA